MRTRNRAGDRDDRCLPLQRLEMGRVVPWDTQHEARTDEVDGVEDPGVGQEADTVRRLAQFDRDGLQPTGGQRCMRGKVHDRPTLEVLVGSGSRGTQRDRLNARDRPPPRWRPVLFGHPMRRPTKGALAKIAVIVSMTAGLLGPVDSPGAWAAPPPGPLVSKSRCAANEAAGTVTYLTGFGWEASVGILDPIAAEAQGFYRDMCLQGQTGTWQWEPDVIGPTSSRRPGDHYRTGQPLRRHR